MKQVELWNLRNLLLDCKAWNEATDYVDIKSTFVNGYLKEVFMERPLVLEYLVQKTLTRGCKNRYIG